MMALPEIRSTLVNVKNPDGGEALLDSGGAVIIMGIRYSDWEREG